MSTITIDLASPADDPELRELLRDNPIPGTISVTFEREPDYFLSASLGSVTNQTIIARERDGGKIIAMGSRSMRNVYLNGIVQLVGYLGELRISQPYRVMRRALTKAYTFIHQLHQDRQVPFYLTSIIEDNLPARRLFTRGLPGLPKYQEYARMYTLAIYSRRRRQALPVPGGLQLVKASSKHKDEIVACLQRNGPRYQFTPSWDSDALFNPQTTPDLVPEDFTLVLDNEKVVGCLALWDQNRYKQTVVRSYAKPLARWRRLLNVGTCLMGWPVLPSPDESFHFSYASHLAVDDDNPEIFAPILRALYNHAVDQSNSYFMIGLSEAHPFLPFVTDSYRHIKYPSRLYLVAWDDGLEATAQVDDRVPGVEIAIL